MTAPTDTSTMALGDWYATALSWRPQVALFVNEATLLPVLMPMAPAGIVMGRSRKRSRRCSGRTTSAAHSSSGSLARWRNNGWLARRIAA
jgi:hypothetical protein